MTEFIIINALSKKTFIDPMGVPAQPCAGRWILPGGGSYLSARHRPSWFHRLTNRWLLGWKWEGA